MTINATIEGVKGFKVAGVHAGLKADGALDLALIYSELPCSVAGVFTTNQIKAAPVIVDMEKVEKNPKNMRAVAINTKCANACTGQQGLLNAHEMAARTATKLGVAEESVLVMSTGVIGIQLNMEKIRYGIDVAAESLGDDWDATAQAVMTTDTRPKMASVMVRTQQGDYTIAGIAKGAGMIAPNMATMLSAIVTDVAITPDVLQSALRKAIHMSFNRVVIDGDMSTNDTVLALANSASGISITSENESSFIEALTSVCTKLAKDIVRDGEGVTKFITLHVRGAMSDEAAHEIANTIATSSLVKTAFYGGDANWGRIVAAAGRSGINLQSESTTLHIKTGECDNVDDNLGLLLYENEMPTSYSEFEATEIMNAPSITVVLTCGTGGGSAVVWTCDLSHDYVSINGHYRT
jgi:glutamate N-acetyltransferase/amino-acid N-acetyltransferase